MAVEIFQYTPKRLKKMVSGEAGFLIEGPVDFSFEIHIELFKFDKYEWLFQFMEAEKISPIYIMIKTVMELEEFIEDCKQTDAFFDIVKKDEKGVTITVQLDNMASFRYLFPYLVTFGCSSELVLWSNEPWNLSFHDNLLNLAVNEETMVYWIGYDGDFLSIFTGHTDYSAPEKIVEKLSPIMDVEIWKLENDDIDEEY
ncbi:hypothetical protein NLX67_21880 [Domibacillus sp. A3M-37]|uniref:hypothetical protein n=1 Tax=Domibacillus sp. A3M-37 TaxID=2962037 RepID=UPI0020B64F84|nr:hypothetical protein [Domibacillus sp. A3M-37]MCP3764966.1 hypothetical protein [Domibacillus sp. A3M-37]